MLGGKGDQARPKESSLNSIDKKLEDTVPTGDLLDLETDELAELHTDDAYLFNLNKNTDLPLYDFGLRSSFTSKTRLVRVLLDTGASSNYISSNVVSSDMTRIPLKLSHQVETANGHLSVISEKVEFELVVGDITQRVQAYVFDTKFDLILGQQWFKQYKPIPDWTRGHWKLVSGGGLAEVTLKPSNYWLWVNEMGWCQLFQRSRCNEV